MAEIMGEFAHDLDNFVAYYEKQQWDTSFRGEQYPPRIVMEQSTPPLFEVGADEKGFHKSDQPRRRSAGTVPARVYARTQGNGGGAE